MPIDITPRLLSAKDAAAYLGYKDPRSVARLADRGEITRRYLDGRPKYERASLDAYVDAQPEDLDSEVA